jgi:phosphohistidine phosphatase
VKTLTLLRHAKSTWDDPVERDFDRPLNGRGRRAAARIGQWLRDEGLADEGAAFDHVRASPAVRVRQTIEGIEDGLRWPLAPLFDARIYLASAVTLLDIVQGFEPAATALLIGHNPGLEDLLLLLTPDADPLRGEVEIKYSTSTSRHGATRARGAPPCATSSARAISTRALGPMIEQGLPAKMNNLP